MGPIYAYLREIERLEKCKQNSKKLLPARGSWHGLHQHTACCAIFNLGCLRWQLSSHSRDSVCILLSMSAIMIHTSHAYKNMEMTREHISLILELIAMLLSFQMNFTLVTAAVVWAILDSALGLDPLSDTVVPRYSKLRTAFSFLLSMVMSVLMPLVLFVISCVFSALICMPYAVKASSRWFTNLTSSCPCPAWPSMSSAESKFGIVLSTILTVPSRSSSESAIILSKKMLKRVGESRHPWRTLIVVRNHSPLLLSGWTAPVIL